MQSIITKYISATNTRGSRIKAECERGSITISAGMLACSVDSEEAHRMAVDALCKRFAEEDAKAYGSPIESNPWLRAKVAGALPRNCRHAYAFVFIA